MDSASRPEVKYNNSLGDLAEWKLVTFYRSNRPTTKNMYCMMGRALRSKADYPGFTTCKWTTYAQAQREDVGEAEKSHALLMEAAAVINIRRSNNEERRRWIKSSPSLPPCACLLTTGGREE